MSSLHDLSVAEAANALRAGDITAEALAAALLRRAQAQAPLNAFVTLEPDKVMAAARAADERRRSGRKLGPLHGVPIALKDNINTADLPTGAGTPALRAHRPRSNAPVAQALIDAGAIVLGKTGMHELALGITSNNAATGAVRNSVNSLHIPGGSSGGSGAAVGARMAPASLGSDTGGSIRIPAAYCGVMGFRPTVKRWSQSGIVPISTTRDTAGPIARCVGDLALIDEIVTGETGPGAAKPLKGLRIGVPRKFFWEDLEAEISRLCVAALDRLQQAGVTLIEANLPNIAALDEAVGFTVALYEVRRDLDKYLEGEGLKERFADIVAEVASPDVMAILGPLRGVGSEVSEHAYRDAIQAHRPRLIETYRNYFAVHDVDAVVFPTSPTPPPLIGEDATVTLNGRTVPTFATVARNAGPGSNAGLPCLTIPVGLTSQGLPVGLELDGRAGMDRDLLAVGLAMEAVLTSHSTT